jgi:hypothetical protein
LLIKAKKEVVDFRSRMLAFRGACGEPPLRFAPLGVSPVPLIPQESRTLRSNQLVNEGYSQNNSRQHFLKNALNKKITLFHRGESK